MASILPPILFGGVNVLFKTDDPDIHLCYAQNHRVFENNAPAEVTVSVKIGQPHSFEFQEPVFKTKNASFFHQNGHSVIRILSPGRSTKRLRLTLIIFSDHSTAELYFENIVTPDSGPINLVIPPFALDELMAVFLLGFERGIMIHSCGIKTYQNQGLLFAGTSGSGKSSTARLWQESGEGLLLGDERIVIRKQNGKFWLISTAWHGSGQFIGPGTTPLDHLFLLHHAKANQAARLKPSQAVARLLPHCFLPFWDQRAVEYSLHFLEELCSEIPCYDLGFTLDFSAVNFVKCLISS